MKNSRVHFIIFIAVLLALGIAGCSSSISIRPEDLEKSIITQQEWGGQPDTVVRQTHTIQFITLHHGGTTFTRDKDPEEYLRNLQSWSRSEKKWSDIPYHYLIDLDGKIYEGKNINYPGDTNTEYNPTNHALICVLGNFEEVEPNQQQLVAVTTLFAHLCMKFHLPVSVIKSHKDYFTMTVCPGKNLYRYLENGYFREKVEGLLKDKNL